MSPASAREPETNDDDTSAAPPRKRLAAKRRPATILVVEDETLIRLAAADYLRDCGYRVLEAVTARDAERLLAAGESVEIVFSDIDLGREADGFALARRIREHHPDVRILLVSGVQRPVGESERLCDGPFMTKPYSYVELAVNIEALLLGRRRRT
jgi:DNA-binding response OmpR family regulator